MLLVFFFRLEFNIFKPTATDKSAKKKKTEITIKAAVTFKTHTDEFYSCNFFLSICLISPLSTYYCLIYRIGIMVFITNGLEVVNMCRSKIMITEY